jgi:hypothetical protein
MASRLTIGCVQTLLALTVFLLVFGIMLAMASAIILSRRCRFAMAGTLARVRSTGCQLRPRGKKSGGGKTSPLSTSIAAASYSSANSVNTLIACGSASCNAIRR